MQGLSSQFILGASWLSSSLTNPLGLFCIVAMAVSTLLIAVLTSAIYRSRAYKIPLGKRVVEVFTGDSGTATVEFALVCPILMFMSLLLAQTTLLMSGNLFVNYAAYMAARSAIVQLPIDMTDRGYESANQFANDPESPKYQSIHRAAALAILPVAGTVASGGSSDIAGKLAPGMNAYHVNYNKTPANWVDRQLEAKAAYALLNANTSDAITTITLVITEPQGETVNYKPLPSDGYIFGPRDPITVKVQHKFSLAFPYVGAAFSDGRLPFNAGGGLFSTITASCTLTNEGVVDGFFETPTQRNPSSGSRK
jgi:Flp pilus assembly protein TadG